MMGVVAQMPQAPDLGPVKVRHDQELGMLFNVAGVIELCRTGETEKCRKVYREFVKAWADLAAEDLSENEKQITALRAAFATIGAVF